MVSFFSSCFSFKGVASPNSPASISHFQHQPSSRAARRVHPESPDHAAGSQQVDATTPVAEARVSSGALAPAIAATLQPSTTQQACSSPPVAEPEVAGDGLQPDVLLGDEDEIALELLMDDAVAHVLRAREAILRHKHHVPQSDRSQIAEAPRSPARSLLPQGGPASPRTGGEEEDASSQVESSGQAQCIPEIAPVSHSSGFAHDQHNYSTLQNSRCSLNAPDVEQASPPLPNHTSLRSPSSPAPLRQPLSAMPRHNLHPEFQGTPGRSKLASAPAPSISSSGDSLILQPTSSFSQQLQRGQLMSSNAAVPPVSVHGTLPSPRQPSPSSPSSPRSAHSPLGGSFKAVGRIPSKPSRLSMGSPASGHGRLHVAS